MPKKPQMQTPSFKAWNASFGKTQRTPPPNGWKTYLRDGWSGGIDRWRGRYRQYLKSNQWRTTRRHALERANGCCAICGNASKKMEVHHVEYVRAGAERAEDMRVLCPNCHDVVHSMRVKPHIPMDDTTRAMAEARAARDLEKAQRAAMMEAACSAPVAQRSTVRRRPQGVKVAV